MLDLLLMAVFSERVIYFTRTRFAGSQVCLPTEKARGPQGLGVCTYF